MYGSSGGWNERPVGAAADDRQEITRARLHLKYPDIRLGGLHDNRGGGAHTLF